MREAVVSFLYVFGGRLDLLSIWVLDVVILAIVVFAICCSDTCWLFYILSA